MRKNVQPFAGEYGLADPHRKGNNGQFIWLANRQMAASGPGLMVSRKLFTKQKYARAFSENTVYR